MNFPTQAKTGLEWATLPSFQKPGITMWEMAQVLNNPDLLQKTTFIQFGSKVIWNGKKFMKP